MTVGLGREGAEPGRLGRGKACVHFLSGSCLKSVRQKLSNYLHSDLILVNGIPGFEINFLTLHPLL